MYPKSGSGGCISPQIEHRLFSHISSNWRGQTLASHEVKIIDKEIREPKARAITRHDWHGEWNYTLTGAPPEP